MHKAKRCQILNHCDCIQEKNISIHMSCFKCNLSMNVKKDGADFSKLNVSIKLTDETESPRGN